MNGYIYNYHCKRLFLPRVPTVPKGGTSALLSGICSPFFPPAQYCYKSTTDLKSQRSRRKYSYALSNWNSFGKESRVKSVDENDDRTVIISAWIYTPRRRTGRISEGREEKNTVSYLPAKMSIEIASTLVTNQLAQIRIFFFSPVLTNV